MSTYDLAIIGEQDVVLSYRAVGVATFAVGQAAEASETLHRIAREGKYAIIFITETMAEGILPAIQEYGNQALPSIVLVPGAHGSEGFALERIRRIVEKAVGADILFGKEGR